MNGITQLLRQVNPNFIQDGYITSQVFRPTPKDEQQLSVYDGEKISASAAHAHFVQNPSCSSAGIVAVSVDECTTLDLSTIPDPDTFPEHALIDFTGLEKKDTERKAKQLKALAINRGWLFRNG
jgi:hypothetical protein